MTGNVFALERPDVPTFADFWAGYPRKVAKLDAERAWNRLAPAERILARATLPAHIAEWAGRDKDRIPHAATWINGKRFHDELDTAPADAAAQVRRVLGA